MSRKTISLKIDVTKIDKERLFHSEKTGAKYLDAILLFDDQSDKYNNNGMVVESVSKEEKEKGVRGNILGNAKVLWSEDVKPPVNDPMDADDSSLPF